MTQMYTPTRTDRMKAWTTMTTHHQELQWRAHPWMSHAQERREERKNQATTELAGQPIPLHRRRLPVQHHRRRVQAAEEAAMQNTSDGQVSATTWMQARCRKSEHGRISVWDVGKHSTRRTPYTSICESTKIISATAKELGKLKVATYQTQEAFDRNHALRVTCHCGVRMRSP